VGGRVRCDLRHLLCGHMEFQPRFRGRREWPANSLRSRSTTMPASRRSGRASTSTLPASTTPIRAPMIRAETSTISSSRRRTHSSSMASTRSRRSCLAFSRPASAVWSAGSGPRAMITPTEIGLTLGFLHHWSADIRYRDTDFSSNSCAGFSGFRDTFDARVVGTLSASF